MAVGLMAAVMGLAMAVSRENAPARIAGKRPEGMNSASLRGRDARSPLAFRRLAWKDVAIRTMSEFSSDRVLSLAAGVTFYTLLAVFPAIAALVSLYGLFLDPAVLQSQLEAASWVLPTGAIEVMRDQALRIVAHGKSTLGFGFIFSLCVALWGANAGTKAMIEALNVAYGETERRSFLRLSLITLGFTLMGILFACVAMAGILAVPVALELLWLDQGTEWFISLIRWPSLLVVVSCAIMLLYRLGPCRAHARWRWVMLGSVVSAMLWLAVSAGFSWYVSHFGSYNETYGSLGAVIGFMTWIWLSTAVVLFGAELNAELEHQTAVDSTTGSPRPMGARGAHMADTVGEAKAFRDLL
ncbi:YihY/virulence factor BrkB family protein [Azorhizobium oxalatiphilum]|nr:YihY/virulence factor BrkB family protein [Azorhizobium oxalatiphilum]